MSSKRYQLRESDFEDKEEVSSQKISVGELLAGNVEERQKSEAPIDLEKPKSRKKRDYIICMAVVNLVLAIGIYLFPTSLSAWVFGISGMVLFSAGFSWAMWQVIDDY